MKGFKVSLPSGLQCIAMPKAPGNVYLFLARRRLLYPGIIVEHDGVRQEIIVNPEYGRPGPLKIDQESGDIIKCGGSDSRQLVPAGKYLGEHYGHHPFTLSAPLPAEELSDEELEEATRPDGPRVGVPSTPGGNDED